MKSSIFKQLGLIAALLITASSGAAQYNKNVTLRIGDPAPPFEVQTWLKGEPLVRFEPGKVYVLDFWATWCGGCIAAFPHISALADKYKDQARFIAVNSYEDVVDANKGKDPLPTVKEFLATPQGQKLKLDLAVDGQSNKMYATWINTLRRNGFPTTFVIDQEGKIAWVDVNLDHLEWVINKVVARKWDRNQAAEIMRQRDAVEDIMFGIFRSKAVDKTADWRAVLAAAEATEKQFPDRKDAVAFSKFMALLELDIEKVPALLKRMARDPLSRYINLSDAAGLTLRKKNLSRNHYLAIAMVQKRLLSNEYPEKGYGGKTIFAYERLGDTYAKAGKSKKAAASIQKAIALANEQMAPADQVAKLRKSLAKIEADSNRN